MVGIIVFYNVIKMDKHYLNNLIFDIKKKNVDLIKLKNLLLSLLKY